MNTSIFPPSTAMEATGPKKKRVDKLNAQRLSVGPHEWRAPVAERADGWGPRSKKEYAHPRPGLASNSFNVKLLVAVSRSGILSQ